MFYFAFPPVSFHCIKFIAKFSARFYFIIIANKSFHVFLRKCGIKTPSTTPAKIKHAQKRDGISVFLRHCSYIAHKSYPQSPPETNTTAETKLTWVDIPDVWKLINPNFRIRRRSKCTNNLKIQFAAIFLSKMLGKNLTRQQSIFQMKLHMNNLQNNSNAKSNYTLNGYSKDFHFTHWKNYQP